MRINEITTEMMWLTESWKGKLGAAALATGAALGGYSGDSSAQSQTSIQQQSRFSEPPTTSTANGLAFALGVVGRNREFLPDDVITIATRVYNNWKKTATPEMIKKFNTGMNQGAEEWTTQADIDKYAKVIKDYGTR